MVATALPVMVMAPRVVSAGGVRVIVVPAKVAFNYRLHRRRSLFRCRPVIMMPTAASHRVGEQGEGGQVDGKTLHLW
jgi:hypothetical protein